MPLNHTALKGEADKLLVAQFAGTRPCHVCLQNLVCCMNASFFFFVKEFLTEYSSVFHTFHRTEDLQSNTVLLAYFAYHLGVECTAFGGTVPMVSTISHIPCLALSC